MGILSLTAKVNTLAASLDGLAKAADAAATATQSAMQIVRTETKSAAAEVEKVAGGKTEGQERIVAAKHLVEEMAKKFGNDSTEAKNARRELEALEKMFGGEGEAGEGGLPAGPGTRTTGLFASMKKIVTEAEATTTKVRQQFSEIEQELDRSTKSARRALDETDRATDSALSRLKDAAAMFGGNFASMSRDERNAESGGFVSAGYALDVVKQYVAILDELNSKSDLAMLHGPKLKLGLQQLEDFFKRFFPQFGSLSKLAKEWQNEMNAGVKTAASYKSKNLKKAGSSSSSNSASSTGLVL